MFLKTIQYSAFILLLAVSSIAQKPLSLDEATARTIAQNRDILAAKLAVQAKENETLATKTKRWPSLSVTGQVGPLLNRPDLAFSKGALGSFTATGPIPANDINISIPRKVSGYEISQIGLPLTQQWRLAVNVEQARTDALATHAQEAQIRTASVARVRSLYFQIVALDSAQKVAQLQLDTAEEISRLAQEGVQKGTALPADEARASARLAQAKADVANLAADLQDAAEQLNLFMGDALDTHYVFTANPFGALNITQEEAQAQAVSQRPELKEARLRLLQAKLSVRSKRLEKIPDLNLFVSDIYLLNTTNYLPSQLATAGVSLNWEPWDWGRKQHEAAALRAKAEQQQLATTQLEQQIKFEADRAWREYSREERNWQASQLTTKSAEEQLRVVKERYAKQAALLRDLLEAQTNWEAAGQAEARARASLGTAWANLQAAMGKE